MNLKELEPTYLTTKNSLNPLKTSNKETYKKDEKREERKTVMVIHVQPRQETPRRVKRSEKKTRDTKSNGSELVQIYLKYFSYKFKRLMKTVKLRRQFGQIT